MPGPFLGRAAELTSLEELCRPTVRGGTAAGFVVGDPGSGKSRLLTELRARVGPARVFQIRGYEPEQAIAFAAAREFLVTLGLDPGRFDAGQARIEIFEAALQALGHEPALVFVDDLHWVDETSSALCHYLLRGAAAEHRRLVMICAGRPAARTRELDRAIDRLEIPRLTIRLGPLPLADGVRLVRYLAPGVQPREAEALWQRAMGSPFWLEQLVAGVLGGSLPAAEAMLDSLSDEEGTILALLVAAARPLATESVAELLDTSVAQLTPAFRALGGIGLVVTMEGLSGSRMT